MSTRHSTVFLTALVALLATAACRTGEKEILVQPAADTGDDVQVVLRSYDVPAGQGQQVNAILSSVFHGVKDKVAARAALTPDGQLVVVAPPGIHEGLQALLAKMKGRKPVAPPSVEISYWLLVGRPAPSVDLSGFPAEIEPAVKALVDAQGPMELALLEKLTVRSLSDARGQAAGRYVRAEQIASVSDDKIVADLDLAIQASRFETRVSIPTGKLLVLGQTGFEPPPGLWPIRTGVKKETGPATLFYIVRANIEDNAG